jgi:type IV pilus assembly protein PilA
MDKLMEMKAELEERENKGFTLMEMLIVVAIIAVLIAIAIPVFTGQLENAREATDATNLRSAYADVMAKAIVGTTDSTNSAIAGVSVTATQTQSGWQNEQIKNGKIGDISVSTVSAQYNGSKWSVKWDQASTQVKITNA